MNLPLVLLNRRRRGGAQIITATVAPAAYAYSDGDALNDHPSYATLDSTGNYASTAGTITSVEWLVNGTDQAGTFTLSAGESVVVRVTDSAANTREWTIDASVAAIAPAQFGTGDWSLANDGVDVTLTVSTLPDDGGSALTDLEYAVNGGSYTSLGAATTGDYTITASEGDTVTLRAVNAVGSGTASASKTVPAASGSFDPANLFGASENGLIWDPSDASTVFQDAGVTAAGNGDPIGQINDLSPNGKAGTQATTADKPTLVQDAGGKWGMSFDGAGDYLNFATVQNIGTVGVAYKLGSGETSGIIIYQGSGDYLDVFQDGNTGSVSSDWGTDTTRVDGVAVSPLNRDTLHDAMAAGTDGKTVILSEHNGSVPSGTSGIGNYGGPFILSGTVYALVVIDRLLTTTERDNLEAWLAEKSGVTL